MVAFLLFVAPGIVYELRRERRLPQLERTGLREAASIALASVIFSGGALLLLAAARALWPSTMPDVHRWVAHPHAYLVAHYAVLGRTLAIAVALAVVLALIAAEVFTWDYRGASIHPQDTIWYLFHREDRDGLPFVTVKTTGGMVFVGPVRTFDSSGDRADRHLVIGPPLTQATYGNPDDPPTIWDRVVVALDTVEHMYVTFAPNPAEKA